MATLPSIGGLHEYTVQEKLNKMAVDLITITPTIQNSDTDATGDVLFDSIEIPNAVSVDGGSSLLQSVAVFHK